MYTETKTHYDMLPGEGNDPVCDPEPCRKGILLRYGKTSKWSLPTYAKRYVTKPMEMMELIEYNHVRVAEYLPPEMESVYRTEELAERVNECMDLRRKNS